MPQAPLTVVKSEPLGDPTPAPLTVVKSEPLQSAAAPPPAPPTTPAWKGWGSELWDAAKRTPRTLLNAGDLGMAEDTPNAKIMTTETAAGMAGAALATSAVTAAAPVVAPVAGLAGVAKAIPMAWRAGRAVASVAGAGAGGGAAAVAEGKPLTGQDSVAQAAQWQAGLQAMGLPVGWLVNFAGRRIMASTVGKQALEWLGTSRAKHVEDAGVVLTQAQDALDAHAASRAAARAAEVQEQQTLGRAAERTATVNESRTAQLKAQWPAGETAPPVVAPMTPVPAHAPVGVSSAAAPPPASGRPLPPPHTPSYVPTAEGKAAAQRELETSGLTPGLAGRAPRFGGAPADRRSTPRSATTPPPGEIPTQVGGTTPAPDRPPGPWDRRAPLPTPGLAADRLTMPTGAPRIPASATAPPPMAPVPAHAPAGTGQPSYGARATRQVADVVGGPVQTSKEQLGAAVEGAAETGPELAWTPIKTSVQRMFGKTQPSALAGAVEGDIPADIAGYMGNQTPEQIRAFMAKAGIPLEEAHPLPGVLGQLQQAGDTISFADAHRFKRLLDDAIGWKPAGAVVAPARGQLKQITKGIRSQLRQAMAEHAPYNQATAAYAGVSKLLGPKGLARQIQAAAEGNPDALVNSLVKPSEPTKFRMLKEVLTHQAEQGGGAEGAAQGANAWAAVQSTVMYQHLIRPGIDKWEQSLAKLHPEFLQTLTEEPYAKAVFDRLGTIAQAVKQSEAQAAAETGVIAAQQAGHVAGSATRKAEAAVVGTGLRRTQREAARGVQEARRSPLTPRVGEDQVSRMLTQQEDAFRKSSLGNPASTTSQVSDLTYATTAPPGSPRQMAGMARLLWKGPKANDLVHWASLSDDNTQMFVRAYSGPNSAQAVSNLIRGVEELYRQHSGRQPKMAVSHQQGSATSPPPGPGR